jgi:hypothetical protein
MPTTDELRPLAYAEYDKYVATGTTYSAAELFYLGAIFGAKTVYEEYIEHQAARTQHVGEEK